LIEIMSAYSRTRRVTHLTHINARVVSGFMDMVSESYRIVPVENIMFINCMN
jgi:hypothetical protein